MSLLLFLSLYNNPVDVMQIMIRYSFVDSTLLLVQALFRNG